MKHKLIFVVIIFLALFLRLYRLDAYPPSFWQDTTANAYDAYAILKTGKDQWGTAFPFPLIKSLGDYKTALPVYFLIPGIKLFGLNEFGVRFGMTMFGAFTVFLAYFVGKKIGKSKTFGLVVAFLLAISPWHIGLSRSGWEASVGIPLILLGLYFFWNGQKSNQIHYLLSTFFLGLASYTYHPYRVFVPLFFFLSFLLLFKKNLITRKWFLINLVLFFMIFLPNLMSLINPAGRVRIEVNRFDKTADFIQQVKNQTVWQKDLTLVSFGIRNYFRLFSTDFLYVWGSTDPVFEIKDRGLGYFWEIPFFAYGLYLMLRRKNTSHQTLLLWLFLWPIPTIIVANPYNLVKTAHLLPLLEIITAIGLVQFLSSGLFNKYKLFIICSLFLTVSVSVAKYFVDYYATYPLYSSSWYQSVEKNTFASIDAHKNDYQKIILSQKLEPYIYLLFYEKIDPNYYQTTKDKTMVMAGKFGEAHLKNLGKYSYSTGIENDISVHNLYAFPSQEIPHKNGYKPVIFDRIKDYLGNEKIVVFSFIKT
ncbi:glycosyltransferase family 39 protein [Candidatus Roizmanbacteria bacterium]|nr:glycosyltransferase family 39 protein [Candidatus Roizmanbacteria bacterium]